MTARPLSHTVELLERLGAPVQRDRPPRRRRPRGQGAAPPPSRVRRCSRFGRKGAASTTALAHGSTDLPAPCRLLRLPNTTMFDYEWAVAPAPRQLPARDARARARRDPGRAPAPLRRPAAEARPLPGAQGGVLPRRTSSPTRRCSTSSGPTRRSSSASCARRPPTPSTWAAPRTRCSPGCSSASHRTTRRRRSSSRARRSRPTRSTRSASPACSSRRETVDGRSLVALADLLVSAGGTMNREAAVLGTPVWSIFEGKPGAVDEHLIAAGRMQMLTRPGRPRDREEARS